MLRWERGVGDVKVLKGDDRERGTTYKSNEEGVFTARIFNGGGGIPVPNFKRSGGCYSANNKQGWGVLLRRHQTRVGVVSGKT